MQRLGSVLFALFLFAAGVQARQEPAWPAARAALVDRVVEAEMKKADLVGAYVGVIEDGHIVFTKGYGWADREKQTPVTDQTLFRWASVSKPITAVAAMQLVEAGKLDLDQDVRDYVPEFPDHGAKITARHLLCHQSGIVHYANGKVVRTKRTYAQPHPYEDVVLALDQFKESPLVNQPGEKMNYSTHAYILLSAVVERAGQQKFADQVKERISGPLGLATLRPDYQWEAIPNRAVGYRKGPGGTVVPSTNTDVSWKLGGGGFLSSGEDMAKFAHGLLGKSLLKPATKKQMWTPQKLADGKPGRFGLGFGLGRIEGLGQAVSHSGSQEKTRTDLAIFPEKGRGVVFLSNSEYANPEKITAQLREALWK